MSETFTLAGGTEHIRAVAQTLALSTYTGGANRATFQIVVGADDPDPISRSVAARSYSAPPNFQAMFSLLRPGSVVLDLGAHVGTFALAAAAAGCRVIAVEAAPHNAALLRESASRNHFSELAVVQAAVSDRLGELKFVPNGPYGQVAQGAAAPSAVTVRAVTVEALLAQFDLERVDLVKLDVEGSEVAAIRGMGGWLARPAAPPIFYESNGHTLWSFGETPSGLKRALEAFGFRNYLCEPDRLTPVAADELQAACVVDYLAVKEFPAPLLRWRRSDRLAREDQVRRVLAESQNLNPYQRAYLARAMDANGRDLLADPRVRQAILALSRDADPAVQRAAAWVAAVPIEKRVTAAPARFGMGQIVTRIGSRLRIGIDYRILSAGINVNRGMGRYTQQQLREVLRLDSTNEYVLFCPPQADPALILPEIRSASNVSIATIAGSQAKARSDPNQPEKVLRFAEEYQDWIYRQGVDLYHATAPFLWHETVLPHFDACPLVVNFYDAIPLIFPDQYFTPGDPRAALYARAAHFIRGARRFIAISESARRDAAHYFGFPADRIDIAYPVADPGFQALPAEGVSARLRELRARVGLPKQFALAVTHLHHSKGLDLLLDAYALLPRPLRTELPLVITCHLTPFEQAYVNNLAQSRGIDEDVIVTGQVSDDELAALYNAAAMLIHASRYEGFGLPVLEAMRCGAPVVAFASSSLPEVGGAAAAWVEPDDGPGLARAVESLYADPDRRQTLSQLGVEQARKFDPDQLGRNTLDCYHKALQPAAATEPDRPRLALWTPLPPQRSGVANYSAHILLEPLSRRYEVEVFVDDDVLPDQEILQSYRVQHHSAFERRRAQAPFDAVVYQLGASLFHLYMYRYLQAYPGAVVLHDLTWSYALHAGLARQGQPDRFLQELLETEGPAAVKEYREVAQAPGHLRAARMIDFLDRHLMLKKIVARSLGLIVHLEASAQQLRQEYGAAKVVVVPHGAEDLLLWPLLGRGGDGRLEARAAARLPEETFLVGVFGILDPVKRVEVTLRAFVQLLAAQAAARLVIVGEAYDPAYGASLQSLAQSLGLTDQVVFTGYASDQALKDWVRACDVVVNLRYPSRQQMSGTLARALAAGKPVIMTDLPEWLFLPEAFCWRVAPDEHEVETLTAHLRRLAADGPLRASLSAQARAYYERELAPWRMAERYQAALGQIAGLQPDSAQLTEPAPARAALALNKPIEVEDFEQADMIELVRDIFAGEAHAYGPDFPRGAEHGLFWGAAMALHTLRQTGQLRREAHVLVAGAGLGPLPEYLTRQVGRVFAIDRYQDLVAAVRQTRAAPDVSAPETATPEGVDLNRLVVQHMDVRALRFPDLSFDAVIVSAPVNNLGRFPEIASALFEIGRVLKPGGVASLTLNYCLAGPAAGVWPEANGQPLPRCELDHFVVEASGLELIDELRTEPSARTLAMPRRLDLPAPSIGVDLTGPPQFVTVAGGYATTRLHLALRKTAAYPLRDNNWARPSLELLGRIRPDSPPAAGPRHAEPAPAGRPSAAPGPASPSTRAPGSQLANSLDALRAHFTHWSEIRLKSWYDNPLRRLPSPVALLGRTLARLAYLGHSHQAQEFFYQALLDHLAGLQNQLAENAGRVRELSEQVQSLSHAQQTLQQTLERSVAQEQTPRQTTQAEMEGRLAQADGARAAAPRPPVEAGAVTPGELLALLKGLEQQLPSGAELAAVEIGLAGGDDAALLAGWAAHLPPGGYGILVSAPDSSQPAAPSALEQAADLDVESASGRRLRATAWRRRADAA